MVVLLILPPLPEKLKRGFSEKEKQIALRRQRDAHMDAGGKKFDVSHVRRVFKDPKMYGFGTLMTEAVRELADQPVSLDLHVCKRAFCFILNILTYHRPRAWLRTTFDAAARGASLHERSDLNNRDWGSV